MEHPMLWVFPVPFPEFAERERRHLRFDGSILSRPPMDPEQAGDPEQGPKVDEPRKQGKRPKTGTAGWRDWDVRRAVCGRKCVLLRPNKL